MKDENGNDIAPEVLLKDALDALANACEMLYEIDEDDRCIALACMVNAAFEYGSAIMMNEDPRLSDEYRYQERVEKKKKNDEVF